MTADLIAGQNVEPRSSRLRTVLCGSYRRDPDGLHRVYRHLAAEFDVLSPRSVDFVDWDAEFVRLESELADSIGNIEQLHLAAISGADFVWLFAPDGYVGTSAALELGHACALGVPVFTDTELADGVLASMVTRVASPADACQVLAPSPGKALSALQLYYGRIAQRRGWADESPRDTLLLLTEELGELAHAVRKSAGLARHGRERDLDVEQELADVQLYLVHLANVMGLDLSTAVTEKEQVNAKRHEDQSNAAA